MFRTVLYSLMLIILVIISLQSLKATVTVEDVTPLPKHTAPVRDLTDAQDARIVPWERELLGKKIGDINDAHTVTRADLPPKCRVIAPGTLVTTEVEPDRLNVLTNENGTVIKVRFG